MICALIMAGGSGQRFWPLSTEDRPKQLLKLFSDKSMIRETVDRILPLIPSERVFVGTNIRQVKAIKKELPMIIEDNIIIEPEFRDTAAAIGYGTLIIENKYPNSQIVILASDHLINDEEKFRDMLKIASNEAKENNTIVTLGIKPNKPETGYGYLEIDKNYKLEYIYQVHRFLEKPNIEKAKQYVQAGNFLWNSGMFIFSTKTIFEEIERYMPKHFNTLIKINEQVHKELTGEQLSKAVGHYFEEFEKISIDFGVMEKSTRIKVIPTDFGWDDIGSFLAFAQYYRANENGTIIKNSQLRELNCKNNIIVGTGSIISTIGVQNLVIIQTEDKLLICSKDQVQDIKKILS